MKIKLFKLIAYILIPLLVGGLGSFFTISSIPTWYVFLNKPVFSPPNWIFAPVWTVLYVLMGVSAYFASEMKAKIKNYWIQLVLNALWTPIFFGLHSPALGLIVILALWWFILRTIKDFYKTNKTSAYLLIPYLLWVSFATILNFAILILN
ncbi:TspO/MBR family protein [uncultured archaeon]|nr:TspO/MBR family protein [uncultured archaeon]